MCPFNNFSKCETDTPVWSSSSDAAQTCAILPLWHDLVGIWKIAVDVLHLEGVSIANLVVRSAVVGGFDHYDITSWTPKINGVAFTRQLSPHQAKRQDSPTKPWGRGEKERALSVQIEKRCGTRCDEKADNTRLRSWMHIFFFSPNK